MSILSFIKLIKKTYPGCPNCKDFILDHYCSKCGTKAVEIPYPITCAGCGQGYIYSNIKYCSNCGKEMPK